MTGEIFFDNLLVDNCMVVKVKISILTTRSEPLRRPWSRETCPWSVLDQCDSPWSPLPVNTWSRSLIRSPISSPKSPLYQPHQYVWNLISVVFPVEYCPTNSTEGLPVKSASFNDIIKYMSPGSPSLQQSAPKKVFINNNNNNNNNNDNNCYKN